MEIAEVSVTSRAPAALAMEKAGGGRSSPDDVTAFDETKPKRRRRIENINSNNSKEEKLKFSSVVSSSSSETKPDYAVESKTDERCFTPTFSDERLSSCCSSNGSIGLYEHRIQFVDLEVDSAPVETSTTCNCGDDKREMSPPSNELRAPNSEEEEEQVVVKLKPTEANNSTRYKKMPTEEELEEFFSAAESEIQKSFAEKYNYDIVKDVPLLEGRYEWVQIKP